MSVREPRTAVLTGASGTVGTYAAIFLARAGVADVLHLATRDLERIGTALYNARVCALQADSPTRVEPLALDLLDVARGAETLRRLQPTLVVNCAALLSLYPFFPALRRRQQRLGLIAGFGHTLSKDLATLWPLMRAVTEGSPATRVVNLAAPDTAHAILRPLGLSPTVGAGTIDSTAQGVRMAAARSLGCDPRHVDVRLVCHHAIRRLPVGSVPFVLRVYTDGAEATDSLSADKLIAEAVDVTGVETMTTPVHSNAAITAASAVAAAEDLLQDSGRVRHGAGAQGSPGGTPVRLSRNGAEIVLPDGLAPERAEAINLAGVRLTGVETIHPDGSVTFTDREQYWLREGLGLRWSGMRLEEALPMSGELAAAYRRMDAEERG